MGGAVLLVRNRYDLRGALLLWAMLLRLVAIVIGAQHGLDWLFAAVVVAQAISTLTMGTVALAVFRRWPRVQAEPLGEDQPEIKSFAIQSTIASGLMSVRTSMPVVLIGIVAKPAAGRELPGGPRTADSLCGAVCACAARAARRADPGHRVRPRRPCVRAAAPVHHLGRRGRAGGDADPVVGDAVR